MSLKNLDIATEASRVLRLEGEAILQAAQRFEAPEAQAQLKRALEIFKDALTAGGKIIVTGVGKSGKVGQKIAATFSSTGSMAVFIHPTEGLHGDLGLVSAKDAVLALSYTGNTEELISLLPSLKALGVPIIGICGNPRSKLAESCDVSLDGAVVQEACPHNLAPTSSTTLALAIGDALAVALMKLREFDAEAFAQNHPGGSIGRRLHLSVQDVMHRGEAVGVVGPDASMDEVVVISTRKKLGAVLVTSGEKLLGIVTDGDLRRALQHREKFFDLKASQVMTAGPVTATTSMKATAALDLMENRPSQISVLPVVDEQGRWK
ncbi:MAG TPA: KpsF/GutQ family sugar-phosphate isomerase, partial [Bdellovibrionota bacterium]|nr:KpsF/GutQ family sugar-phosphate isomerase [Bdellovibrionota bacterium]